MAHDNCPSDGCVVVLAVVVGCHLLSLSCITVNVSLQKFRIVCKRTHSFIFHRFFSIFGGLKNWRPTRIDRNEYTYVNLNLSAVYRDRCNIRSVPADDWIKIFVFTSTAPSQSSNINLKFISKFSREQRDWLSTQGQWLRRRRRHSITSTMFYANDSAIIRLSSSQQSPKSPLHFEYYFVHTHTDTNTHSAHTSVKWFVNDWTLVGEINWHISGVSYQFTSMRSLQFRVRNSAKHDKMKWMNDGPVEADMYKLVRHARIGPKSICVVAIELWRIDERWKHSGTPFLHSTMWKWV